METPTKEQLAELPFEQLLDYTIELQSKYDNERSYSDYQSKRIKSLERKIEIIKSTIEL